MLKTSIFYASTSVMHLYSIVNKNRESRRFDPRPFFNKTKRPRGSSAAGREEKQNFAKAPSSEYKLTSFPSPVRQAKHLTLYCCDNCGATVAETWNVMDIYTIHLLLRGTIVNRTYGIHKNLPGTRYRFHQFYQQYLVLFTTWYGPP